MRMIVAAAIAAITLTGAVAVAQTQIAAKPDGEVVNVAEVLTTADARKAAREYLKAQDMNGVVVDKIRQRDGKFHVDVTSVEGIPVRKLVIDARTGKVEG